MSRITIDEKICINRKMEVIQLDNRTKDIITRFDIDRTCTWIKDNGFSKVCLQFPDEILNVGPDIYEEIKKRVNVDLYILGDTSYASCCVDSVAAMHVRGEAVIHYGPSCFSKTDIPTLTILPKRIIEIHNIKNALINHFSTKEVGKLCLFYDAEFEHCIDDISACWFEIFPDSYIAYLELEERADSCHDRMIKNQNNDQASPDILKDCICLYIGTRGQTLFNFTISIAASKWYSLDPNSYLIQCKDETSWFKRRRFLIEKCKDANVVGILVCKLSGDQTREIIRRLKILCRVNGKKSYIVSVGKPNVAKLANFPEIDIFVMIACPENDLYNNREFYKPIVYPFELEVALNSNREPYSVTHITDFDELLPGRKHYCDINHVKETIDVSLITGKIRQTNVKTKNEEGLELAEKQNWALENIGGNLSERHWKGLEQQLGETEVTKATEGRKGIPLHYSNEPE